MPTPISYRLFWDYLKCKYKAYLKLTGKIGQKTDVEEFQERQYQNYRRRALEYLLTKHNITSPPKGLVAFKDVWEQKLPIAINVAVNLDVPLIMDAVVLDAHAKRHNLIYNPITIFPDQKVTKQHKLLLAFCGAILGNEQKCEPDIGIVIHGGKLSSSRVQLGSLISTVSKIKNELFDSHCNAKMIMSCLTKIEMS